MIYLVLTASLFNRSSSMVSEDRLSRYHYALEETLRHLPHEGVQPIIVENTSTSEVSPLDKITYHEGKVVPVLYTTHGELQMRNKGVNEWLDIKAVMEQWKMKDTDILVKLTGRYRLLSPCFMEYIQRTADTKDAWFRFMNVCTGKDDPEDCVLGCYAAKVSVLRYLSWSWVNLFDSPEHAMAKHIRSSVSANRLVEMDYLGVECVFSENGRVLCV